MQQPQGVPLIAAKRFRYNRRDIQLDAPFEAVSPSDADILVKAKLARRPPPPATVQASTATDDGARSLTREVKAEHLEERAAELEPTRSTPKKKRVAPKRRAVLGDPPAQS